jgi:RHS repeat-associated protein
MSEAGKLNLGLGTGMQLNQAQKAADSKEYLVEGAKLFCVNGSNITQLKLPTGHGYTSGGKKKVNCKDCKACENIPYFGECRKNEKDHKCEGFMDLVDKWENTAVGTGKAETVGGEEAISMSSVLLCKKGGVIIPVTSGQGYDGKINWAAFLKRYQNVFRWVAGKNLLCQVFGKDPINMNTGNYIYEKEDLVINGNMPLSFQLFYNAMDCGDQQVLGEGWNHNYGVRLIKIKEEELLGVVMEDGRELPYCRKLGDSYAPVLGDGGILSRLESGYQFAREDGTVYEFDQEGKLCSQKDRNGNNREFTYNSDGLLECVENGTGGRLNYTYNQERKLIYVEDHTGRKISLIYQYGKLRWFNNSMGNTYTYEYNENGKLNGIITPRDILGVKNEYDGADRVRKQMLPDGGVTEFRYDDENNRTYMLEQNGNLVIYECDKRMRNVRTIYKDGEEIFEYNDRNQKIRFTDKNGNTTRYAYDNRGNLTQVINALRLKTCMTYNEENLLVCLKFPDSGQIKFHYDEQGNLIETVNQLGYSSKAVYDGKGRVICVIQPDNSEIHFDYNENGNIVCFTDALGNKIRYEYDERNQIIREEDGNKNEICYTYNSKGDIEEIINAAGNKRRYEYNASGKIITMVDYDGTSHHMDYDDCNNLCSYEDAEGNETLYQYDKMGNLEKITYANGGECIYTYDHLNRLKSFTDAVGAVIQYEYDAVGNLTKLINSEGEETSFTYDALNRRTSVCTADGAVTSYEYDINGKISKVTDALGNTRYFEYDLCGRKIKETDILGNVSTYEYNSLGRLISITDGVDRKTVYNYFPGGLLKGVMNPNGTYENYNYDGNSNLITRKNQEGNITQYKYDKLYNVIECCNNRGQKVSYTYDVVGNLIGKESEHSTTKYTYSSAGNLTEVSDPLGNLTRYQYDCMNQLTCIWQVGDLHEKTLGFEKAIELNKKHHNLHLTVYNRDLLGRIVSMTDALGNTEYYEYDLNGYMSKVIDREGYETSFSYNSSDKLDNITYNNDKQVKFNYSPSHQLANIQDWLGTTQIESDDYGRIISVTDHEGNKVGYEYGSMGERKTLIYPDGTKTHYSYDHCLRLSKLRAENYSVEYKYDKNGSLEEKSLSNGLSTQFNYNELGFLTEIVHKDSYSVLSKYLYEYDNAGNQIRCKKDNYGLGENADYMYSYDAAGHLLKVKKDNTELREYGYDPFGNRKYLIENSKKITYNYNAANQLMEKIGAFSEKYSYDCRGNLSKIIKNGEIDKTYIFDETNRLNKVETASGDIVTYGYNGIGKRTLIKTGKTNSQNPVFEQVTKYRVDMTLESNNLLEANVNGKSQRFIWDGNIVSANTEGRILYYLSDALGSPVRLLSQNSKTIEFYSYDEFGNELIGNAGIYQPFTYTGYIKDKIADTYFAQAREYQPTDGRFISEDWINGTIGSPERINPYGYCYNNPLMYVDSNGKFAILVTMAAGALIGGAIGGVGSIASDLYHGRDVNWKKAGVNALKGGAAGAIIGTGVGAVGAVVSAAGAAAGTAAATTTAIVNTMQVSAGIGSAITGGLEIKNQVKSEEEIDVVKLGIKEAEGAASGMLMGSPAKLLLSIAGNAAISAASSYAYDKYNGEENFRMNMLNNGFWGGVGGAFGGVGAYAVKGPVVRYWENSLVGFVKKDMYAQIGTDVILKNVFTGSAKMLGYGVFSGYIPEIMDRLSKFFNSDKCKAVN